MMRPTVSFVMLFALGCGQSRETPPAAPPPPQLPAAPVAAPQPTPVPAPAFAAIAEAESRWLAAQGGHVWNNIVVLDAATSEVLASVGTTEGVVGAADATYPPGSVAKLFTVAAALAQDAIADGETFEGKGGTWRIDAKTTLSDGQDHGVMSAEDLLAFSSNIATSQLALQLDRAQLQAFWGQLGFDAAPPAFAAMPDGAYATYVAGASEALRVQAVAVAKAFAALVGPNAAVLGPAPTARLRQWLRAPVGPKGTGARAAVPGLEVIGKTGTLRGKAKGHAIGHFVGAFPATAPRYVIVVVVETTAKGYAGGQVAAPSFARLAAQLAP